MPVFQLINKVIYKKPSVSLLAYGILFCLVKVGYGDVYLWKKTCRIR